MVEALGPGTLYNFSVWAERNDMASSMKSLQARWPLLPGGALRSDLGVVRHEWTTNPIRQ